MKKSGTIRFSLIASLLIFSVTACHTGGGGYLYVPFPISIQFTGESYAGNGFVHLDWQDYPLQDTSFMLYVLSRGPSAGGPWTVIAEIPDRSEYNDTNVSNGTTYFYSVQVKRNDGKLSARAIGGPFRPHSDTTPPPPPTNLQAGGGDGIVVLFWSSPGGGTVQFRLYRNTSPSVPTTQQYYLASVPGNVTTYNDTSVQNRITYWYVVTAVDAEGNESGASNLASATPLPDTTPPETTIQSNPPALSNSSSATFTFTSNESGSTFQCALDGSGFSGCSSPQSYIGLSDGPHTFAVRAIDPSGNVDPTPAAFSWTIDTTPPNTIVSGGPPALTNQTSANFNLQSNESPVTFECSLDGSAFATCPGTVNYTNLGEGSHTFEARARDLAGNVDPSPASHSWTIDITPPALTLTQTPPVFSNQTTATFDWTSSEISTYMCSLDGAPYAACPGKPAEYSNLSEGAHTFRVRGTDTAGNIGNPAIYGWTVDLTPPSITNLQGPPSFTNSTVANFSWSISDNLSGITAVECQTVNVDPAFRLCATQSSDIVSGLTSGSHTWRVRARDNAGNQSPPLNWNWYVDITGPGVTVLAPNGGENVPVGSTQQITWTAIDAAQSGLASHSVYFSVDGGVNWTIINECRDLPPTMTTCQTNIPNDISLITSTARVRVVSTDMVGNTGEDVSDANFTISDQTPPAALITRPFAGENVQADPPFFTIQWTSSDNIGIGKHDLFLSLDGGANPQPIPECTNLSGTAQSCNWDPPNVNNFNAVIVLCVTDITTVPPAPNTTCVNSSIFSILYDTTPPEAPTITSGPAEGSLTNQNAATFEFIANDPAPNPSGIARYECSRDGSPFVTCTSPVTYTGLSDGPHTFRVRAVDNAGNTGPETARNWSVDITPPTLTLTAPNGGEHIPGNSTFTMSWTAADAGSGLAGNVVVEYSADNGGNYSTAVGCENVPAGGPTCNWNVPADNTSQALVRVTVSDLAGNATSDVSNAVFTVDSTPPTVNLTNGPCGLNSPCFTNQNTATFEFAGNDNFTPTTSLTYQCTLDGGAPTPCTSPQAYTGLAEGPHSFSVVATDLAGLSGSPATFNWTVDLTPPAVTVTFPNVIGDFVRVPATNTITWQATDAGSGLSYFRIELSENSGATWTVLNPNVPFGTACPAPPDCSYNWSITNPDLFNRTNLILVRAYDLAGNEGQDASDNNFSYAFYERHEPENSPSTFAIQHPSTALRRWWNFGFGGAGATYTCPDDPSGENLFRWFGVDDNIFGVPQDNHSQNWFLWAVCQTATSYFYPPAPNERIGRVAGPFPLTDATSAFFIVNIQWDLDPADVLYLLVSSALATETSACNTSGLWTLYDVGFTGTSPNFGAEFQTATINLSTLPDPGDGPIIGSTRCFGLVIFDLDADGSQGHSYEGVMADDFTIVKF
ncbi:MAG: fibronectin type III domain-containing protein [bacterium JZ-2024 1]